MPIGDAPRRSHVDRHRVWLVGVSLGVAAVGAVILLMSLLPSPDERVTATPLPAVHVATHAPDSIIVPGVALHPGPQAATLAAELDAVVEPVTIRPIAIPRASEATPLAPASPGADETTRSR